MTEETRLLPLLKVTAMLFLAACGLTCFGQQAGTRTSSGATPLMAVLDRFTAADVPVLGPGETYTPPLRWDKPVPAGLPGRGMDQHPMLYAGEGYDKIFVVHEGRIVWTYSTGTDFEYDDFWMLSNGNVLFTRMQYVAEVTPAKQVVWRYDAPAGTEIHTCQPIGADKVMFVLNGLPPRLMVVDIKTNQVLVEHALPAPSLTDRKTVHGQYRRVRYTAQGTYLLAGLEMNQVIELDKQFREVWSYQVPTPWAAIRLKNGNTLITDERDVKTIEVTPDKKIAWEISPAELPAEYRYENSQSVTRLANGNTIVCSRGGSDHGPQLVEVTPDKKIVWVLWDWKDFGPASAVQILDDPGVPEDPGQSEH